jgi:phosphatidate cytidylyltransferase
VKNLITRTITGIVFVAAIIGSILWHPFAFGALFLLVTILGVLEFYKLVASPNIHPQKITGILIACTVFILSMLASSSILPVWALSGLIPLLSIFFIIELYRKKPDPVNNFVYSLFAIIYIAVPFSLLNFFFNPSHEPSGYHPFLLIGYFALVWINDIFAYLTGILVGKHKLFERVSPNKTWEGTAGGFVFTVLIAWLLSRFLPDLRVSNWIIIAILVTISGTFGDLCESMIKRKFNIKDTGTILPGHGGILDRFDALFLSAPVILFYLYMIYG